MEEEMLRIEDNEVVCCDENAVEIVIPDGVKVIKTGAFDECEKLEKVVMPDSITKIESCAFCQCTNLKEVVFSKNLKEIGELAFSACVSLKSLDLPESLQKIEALAFLNCRSLKKLFIPKNVSMIDELIRGTIIEDCDNLEFLEVDKENKVYDSRDNCNCIIETAKNEIKMLCKTSNIPMSATSMDRHFHIETILKELLQDDLSKYTSDNEITEQLTHNINIIKNPFLWFYDKWTSTIDYDCSIFKNIKIELSNEKVMIDYPQIDFKEIEGLVDENDDCWRNHINDKKRISYDNLGARFMPPSQVALGCYKFEENKVVLYIKSILEASQKENIDFTDYIFSVLSHEFFHAYHAGMYNKKNKWIKDYPNHRLIIESLASYAQYLFTEKILENQNLSQLIKNSWDNYSMLVYPYSGAKVIEHQERSFRRFRYSYTHVVFNALRKIYNNPNLVNIAKELFIVKDNECTQLSFFKPLFELSLYSLQSGEAELLSIASKLRMLL